MVAIRIESPRWLLRAIYAIEPLHQYRHRPSHRGYHHDYYFSPDSRHHQFRVYVRCAAIKLVRSSIHMLLLYLPDIWESSAFIFTSSYQFNIRLFIISHFIYADTLRVIYVWVTIICIALLLANNISSYHIWRIRSDSANREAISPRAITLLSSLIFVIYTPLLPSFHCLLLCSHHHLRAILRHCFVIGYQARISMPPHNHEPPLRHSIFRRADVSASRWLVCSLLFTMFHVYSFDVTFYVFSRRH